MKQVIKTSNRRIGSCRGLPGFNGRINVDGRRCHSASDGPTVIGFSQSLSLVCMRMLHVGDQYGLSRTFALHKSGDPDCTSDCARVADRLLERVDMLYMYWNAAYEAFLRHCRYDVRPRLPGLKRVYRKLIDQAP